MEEQQGKRMKMCLSRKAALGLCSLTGEMVKETGSPIALPFAGQACATTVVGSWLWTSSEGFPCVGWPLARGGLDALLLGPY